MRVGLFFSDGVIGNITLNKLIPQMIEIGIEPVLFRSRGPNIVRAKIPELAKLSYLETGLLQEVVEPTLEAMPLSEKAYCTTQQLVQKYNLEFKDVADVNNPTFIDYIKSDKGVDSAISVRFYPKFKKEIIGTFRKQGFLWNLHTGLLPKYKGVYIPYRAIENNEDFYGWTLHEVDYEIDTGAIIGTDRLPLDPTKPVLDTYLDMTNRGGAMTMGALLFYQKRGALKAISQVMAQDSYFTYPTSAEIQRWNKQGIIFADDIVKTYTRLYTTSGTPQETALRNKLTEVISNITPPVKELNLKAA